MTEEQIIDAFWQAMKKVDICIEDAPEPDGELHRVYSDGDKVGSKDAWYVLHIDGEEGTAFGCFGHWAHGEHRHLWSSREVTSLSPEQRERYKAKVEAAKKANAEKLAKDREKCRIEAERTWHLSGEAHDDHVYLLQKGIKAHGIKEFCTRLTVPIRNGEGALVGLQFIMRDSSKRFLTGTPKTGNYFTIKGDASRILIAEGYATGASCYEATGYMTIVAFDAGNLLPVARVIRGQYPEAKIIICADNDHGKETNKGLVAGREAATAVGGLLAVPEFPEGDKGTDFNDLHNKDGLQAVRAVIEGASAPKAGDATDVLAPLQTPAAAPEDPRIAKIRELAGMSELEYQLARKRAAQELGIAVTGLDKTVRQERLDRAARLRAAAKSESKEVSASCDMFEDVEPWPHPVDANKLLNDIVALIHHHIVLPDQTAIAAALWITFTWLINSVKVAPMAMITAPEKRCGKSQLLALFNKLCYRPISASNISPAAIYRSIDLWSPTLLIDEADAFLRGNEDARGILNSGHTRDSAFVIRAVEFQGEILPKRFSTWGPKAIAGIGTQAATLMDRSITMQLRRKLPHEQAENIRYADEAAFKAIKQKLYRMARDAAEAISKARPTPLETPNDRAQDNWEPLLAIADYAGGEWPTQARQAALILSCSMEDAPSMNVQLLADIKRLFDGNHLDRMTTDSMIAGLCNDEEAPWRTISKGFPITPRILGQRLHSFNISSSTIRVPSGLKGSSTAKGYLLENFKDAFSRYLQPEVAEPTQGHNPEETGVSAPPPPVTETECDVTPVPQFDL